MKMPAMFAKKQGLLLATLLGVVFIVAIASHLPQLSFTFISDDFLLVEGAAHRGAFATWSQKGSLFFRPLISLSIYTDFLLWGLNPVGYYVTNMLLHGLCSALVTLIAYVALNATTEVSSDEHNWVVPLFSGLLFAVAPTLAGSVIWLSSRTDLVAALFSLGAFFLYILYRVKDKPYLLYSALVLLICGLLSKESAATIPFACIFYELYFQWRRGAWEPKRLAVMVGSVVALIAIYVAVRASVIGSLIGGYSGTTDISRVFSNITNSFIRTFSILQPSLGVGVVLVVFIGAILAIGIRWKRDEALGASRLFPLVMLTLALIIFLPASTYPVSIYDPSAFGGRLLYLPAAFGFIAVVSLVWQAIRKTIPLVVIGVLVFGAYGIGLGQVYSYWSEASHVSGAIVQGLQALPPASSDEIALFLNVPEWTRVGGIHIFRNGLDDAAQLFDASTKVRKIVRVGRQEMNTERDAATLMTTANVYTLSLQSANSRLITESWVPTIRDTSWYSVTNLMKDKMVFHTKPISPTTKLRLLYFSEGKLQEVDAASIK